MAEPATVALRRKIGLRQMAWALLGRVIRRSFFRLVLLFVLLLVGVFLALKALANAANANRILDTAAGAVLDTRTAEILWDRDRTQISGPSLAGTGEIAYFDVAVRRKGGRTAHPERGPLAYDFLAIPEIRLSYDLKRLPGLPVTAVKFPRGLTLHFNIHRGTWLDADLFQSGGGEGGAPALPQVIVDGTARVNLRADGILVEPESLAAPAGPPRDWYEFTLANLRLLPSLDAPDQYQLGGTASAERFGAFLLGGNVRRDGTFTRVLFRNSSTLEVNREFVSILAPDVRRAVDQFQVSARVDIHGGIDIVPGRPVQFSADVNADDGELCFVGFPVRVTDASATVRIRNNALTVDAKGRRNGAAVTVRVDVEDVGGPFELLNVSVDVRDLLVDEQFRRALLPARLQPGNAMDWLTGAPWPADQFDEKNPELAPDKGYPEWPGKPTWDGGVIAPDIDPVLPFICRAFTPMGLADFKLTLKSEAKGRTDEGVRTIEQDLNWKVFIRSATACYTGLPESDGDGFAVPLHECYGVVEGSNRPGQPGRYIVRGYTKEELAQLGDAGSGLTDYEKDGLTGVLKSSGERVWLSAVYTDRRGEVEPARLTLSVKTRGVDFNRDILDRMPANVRDVVARFAPQGKVDVQSATLEMRPGVGDDVAYDFNLAAASVAAEYRFDDAREPMRFREVAGTVEIRSRGNQVRLSRVRGKLLGSPVFLDLQYNNGAIPSLRVQSDEFALKPELEDVLPPGVGAVLRRFKLTGFVSLDITGHRGTDKPDFTQADITFLVGTGERSGSLQFDAFPYALTDVSGRVFVTVTPDHAHVVVREVGGRGNEDPRTLDRARISVSGYVIAPLAPNDGTEGPPAVYDLQVRAQRVPMDAGLLTAMTPMLARGSKEKPALITFIEDLRVSGTVGVNGRIVTDPDGSFDWRLEVYLEGTSVNYTAFPYPLDGLYGTVVVDGYNVALRNVTGRAEKGRFTLHHAGYSEAEGWTVQVSAREMSFHETPTLRRALPEALRGMFTRMNPKGEFDLDLEISGKDDFMRYQLGLDVFRTDLDLGLHFDALTARFDYEGVRQGGVSRSNGRMWVHEVFFKKARFDSITSAMQYFGDRLEFPNLRGRFYDGWLAGRFGMTGDDYSGELEIRRADVRKLGSRAFGTEAISGALDAEIRFHSHIDSQGQIGRGRIDVGPINRESNHPDPAVRARERECRLAAVPLFDAIVKVAGGEQNFDEGHVYFWLGPDRITIRQMDFVSDTARVETFGGDDANYIAYDTAEMRMKLFFTLAPRSPVSIPGVQWILDKLKQILFPLYVTGTLGSPRVEPFSLSSEDVQQLQDEFPRRPRGP
ncbi:MAG: hypothetical protein HS108_10265 [Planctomycetes bacterium]|nr:hypothetical protein [Planctomycetota bacterium]